jgi:hypothetical protein
MRTHDPDVVANATHQVIGELKGLPPVVWISDPNNIALTNSVGDVALFEPRPGGIHCGHYFFLSRGAEAVKAAEEFLEEFFDSYGTKIIGFTPISKRGAVWLTRHLGFSFIEDVDIDGTPHRISVLTKKDYDEQSSRR